MNKFFEINELNNKLKFLRKRNKIIGLCHGVFDLLHVGHIRHFKLAKKKVDFLILSITTDQFVNKGSDRPYFNQKLRAEVVSSIKYIDAVVLSNNLSSEKIINFVRPNYYFKGSDYKNAKKDITGKIKKEKSLVEKHKGKVIYTDDLVFSSSALINNFNSTFNDNQRKFLNYLKKKYKSGEILSYLKKINKQRILIFGESIIDKYVYCDVLGKSGKEPYLAYKRKNEQVFLGGSLAIANQIYQFNKKVTLLCNIKKNSLEEKFVNKKISDKFKIIPLDNFHENIVKTRYLEKVTNIKVFGCYDIDDFSYTKKQINNFLKLLSKLAKKNDMLVICDYGHGLINKELSSKISKLKINKSLNTQLNAANIGAHNFQKYKNINFMIINEAELRYEMKDNVTKLDKLAKQMIKKININDLVVTSGSEGAMLVNKSNKIFYCPAFATSVKDKVGAGDTMLSVISLCLNAKVPKDLSLFFGSIVASKSVNIVANKNPVSFQEVYKSVETILK